MRVFSPIVQPAATFLVAGVTDDIHRCPIRPEAVSDNHFRLTIALHRALQKTQRRLAIPTFRGENLKHLALVIHGAPEVMRLAVDPHEHFVQVPAPGRIRPLMNASFPDLSGEHRTEPVPPQPHRLVTDVDATLEQDLLDLAKRQRIPDVQHHRKADNLRRRVEIAEGILHPTKLRTTLLRIKSVCCDSAVSRAAR